MRPKVRHHKGLPEPSGLSTLLAGLSDDVGECRPLAFAPGLGDGQEALCFIDPGPLLCPPRTAVERRVLLRIDLGVETGDLGGALLDVFRLGEDPLPPVGAALRIRLRRGRAKPIWAGHPFVMSGAVEEGAGSPAAGDVVLVRDHGGRAIGRGFFAPARQIRVRMVTRDPEEEIDDGWIARRVAAAGARCMTCGPIARPSDATRPGRIRQRPPARPPRTA